VDNIVIIRGRGGLVKGFWEKTFCAVTRAVTRPGRDLQARDTSHRLSRCHKSHRTEEIVVRPSWYGLCSADEDPAGESSIPFPMK